MSSKFPSETTLIAKEYYDSNDADNFYSIVWGGENIHIGMYNDNCTTIKDASSNTIRYFYELIRNRLPSKNLNIADLGSGYGGVSRFLCRNLDATISAINISEVENARHKQLNTASELENNISILLADFENIPLTSGSQDLAWCQDALLHSNNKKAFFHEVSRILKNDSYLLLADIIRSDHVLDSDIQEIRERIALDSMGSFSSYLNLANDSNLELLHWEDHTDHLIRHYSEVLNKLLEMEEVLLTSISKKYITNMAKGLRLWIDGGKKRKIRWGVFLFQKHSN